MPKGENEMCCNKKHNKKVKEKVEIEDKSETSTDSVSGMEEDAGTNIHLQGNRKSLLSILAII